jgi:uncharacterized protein
VPRRRLSPSVNRFGNAREFIRRWDARAERSAPSDLRIASSAEGRINQTGRADCARSVIVTGWHPQFEDLIEAGVRPLVRLLVKEFNWITYTSCAGHPRAPSDKAKNEDERIGNESFSFRHVGLLARDKCEGLRQRRWLLEAAAKSNLEMRGDAVVIVREELLMSDDGSAERALDVLFESRSDDETAYFAEIDAVMFGFCEHLRKVIADFNTSD